MVYSDTSFQSAQDWQVKIKEQNERARLENQNIALLLWEYGTNIELEYLFQDWLWPVLSKDVGASGYWVPAISRAAGKAADQPLAASKVTIIELEFSI
jgi:hypothetical protein